ncbi:methyltransferase-like protein 27 [Cheilinus undulatus]|uniref:methyltransferase-like protein 27 n=1 Tax=Cheilinus undulatus TaxID=241271 RepID=UPI001BD69B41|nr:methyltransferase-like protein 27 [Cheilinus undulatus]
MSDGCRSIDDIRTLLQSATDLDRQERMKFYNGWAQSYEQDSELMNYRAPNRVVSFLHANFPHSREDLQVLDVACGSGLAAKLMSEVGFRNFVGVDGSKGMLELAEKTGLYQDLRLALLGTEPLPADTDSFDLVVIIGALRDGFVPVNVIRELCQVTKPGGHVCMSRVNPKSASGERYKQCMEQELQLMVEEGLWSPVATGEISRYMMDVYSNHDNQENDQYLTGNIYLYRKSLY